MIEDKSDNDIMLSKFWGIIFLITILLLITISLVFAEIPIYCPKCKTLLYYYQKDKIVEGSQIKAEDFKPANDLICQPQDNDSFTCPFDNAPLNGWEYWGKLQHYKSFNMAYYAISLLTKDKSGNWIWLPFDVPLLNINNEE